MPPPAPNGRGPKPYEQRSLATLFVRAPAPEFGSIVRGEKTEFRGSGPTAQLDRVETPTPVVVYKLDRRGHDARLMVLTDTWQEPIGAISAESLEREGFPDFAHFRRYWVGRTKKHFKPTRMVCVYRVRPWLPEDERDMGVRIFRRLYGAFT